MATPISKRQQARNERQLQDLIQTVPGNDRCADCGAKNPGWASWNLGVFLCVRCASLHRKLGTHISKVKSLSMDAWSAEQVENMKKVGNVRSNAVYNPQKTRADIPIDADEVDSAVERFIRQKYESRTLSANKPASRQDARSTSTGSWNEEPPPLPPKPKKFPLNFRSASSTSHRTKQDRFTPPMSPVSGAVDKNSSDASKPSISKPSQVFGMKITSVSNNFDQKLAMLRDMGFNDNRRNSEILKSSNGNLDKAVETLVRLGEGSFPPPSKQTPAPRTLTPVSMASAGVSGLSVDNAAQSESRVSNNPWEIRDAAPQEPPNQPLPQASPPLRSQSAGPPSNSWNPFATQPQQDTSVQNLANSFQGLQVSHTGPTLYAQQNAAQQIPSVPQIPQQYQNNAFQPQQTQPNPWQAQPAHTGASPFASASIPQQQATGGPQYYQSSNPFFQSSTSQNIPPTNPWGLQTSPPPMAISQQPSPWSSQTQSPAPPVEQSSNPFAPNPSATTWPPQLQQNMFQQPATESPSAIIGLPTYFSPQQPQQISTEQLQQVQGFGQNPWQQQMPPQQQMAMQQQQVPPQQVTMLQQQMPSQQQMVIPQQHFQQLPPQPTRYDKSSILALYNMPHLAPRQPLQTLQEDPSAVQQQQAFTQRSATMPIQQLPANANPYTGAMAQNTQTNRHVSNESVDFVNMSGRQSPDAFAGLSAQYMR